MIKGIGSLLWKSIRRAGMEDGVAAVLVMEEFKKILKNEFGEKIENRIKVLYLKKKILYLSALSSVVMQEIRMNEDKILKELNKKFNKKLVERLNFFAR
jgi:hypothetical protein